MSAAAKKLLLSAKRAKGNPAVPLGPYDEEALRTVAAECRSLYEDIRELTAGDSDLESLSDGVKATLVANHQAILRNKRCALTYLQCRLEALCQLRLEAGLMIPDDIRTNMSQHETRFFSDYDEIFTEYMREIRLDLTANQRPPKELFVEVRANTDCGELVTEQSGVINLAKGTSHFVRASDVQHLVTQGLLEHVG